MKRSRGHWCWSCGRVRPNEAFSGRDHGRHLCRECKAARRRAARATELTRLASKHERERPPAQEPE